MVGKSSNNFLGLGIERELRLEIGRDFLGDKDLFYYKK
jgi:hypothetical protein